MLVAWIILAVICLASMVLFVAMGLNESVIGAVLMWAICGLSGIAATIVFILWLINYIADKF